MSLEPAATIQIVKVPETKEAAEAWADLNKRLNELVSQGYRIKHAGDTYILLRGPRRD